MTGPGGTGHFTVSLVWTPQTKEWVALGISAVALVLCVVLAVLLRRARWMRRFARRRPEAGGVDDPGGGGGGEVTAAGVSPDGAALGEVAPEPVLASPLTSAGVRPRWWVIVSASLAVGAVGAVIASPGIGGAAAVATALALSLRWARAATVVVAVGLLAAAGLSVVLGQAMHPLAESSNWPTAYETAGVLTWMAAVFLGADAVVSVARTRAARRR